MKKLLSCIALVLVLGFSTMVRAETMGTLYTGAITTNPEINAVLVDTGPLDYVTLLGGGGPGARVTYEFLITTTAAAEFRVQVLNTLAVVVRTFSIRALANSTQHIKFSAGFETPTNYSVRIICPAAITGTVQANIMTGYFELY